MCSYTIPKRTSTAGSCAKVDARLTSWGLDALQGPHQVAEKQIRELALDDLNVLTDDAESNSVRVMVSLITSI